MMHIASNIPLAAKLPADGVNLTGARAILENIRRHAARVLPEFDDGGLPQEQLFVATCGQLQVGQGELAIWLHNSLRTSLHQDLETEGGFYFTWVLELLNELHDFILCHGFEPGVNCWETCSLAIPRELSAAEAAAPVVSPVRD